MLKKLLVSALMLCSISIAEAEWGNQISRLAVDGEKFLSIIQQLKETREVPETRYGRIFRLSAIGIPQGSYVEIKHIKRDLIKGNNKDLFLGGLLHIRGEEDPIPIAISIFFSDQTLRASMRIALKHERIELAHLYNLQIEGETFRLARMPSSALSGRTCSQGHDLSSPHHLVLKSSVKEDGQYKALPYSYSGGTIELRTDTDASYVAYHGSSVAANQEIMVAINEADRIYSTDLNIGLTVLSQANTSQHPSTTDINALLCSVSNAEYGPADDILLFSGGYLNLAANQTPDGVVGLAWLGGICQNNRAFTQECSTSTHYVNRAVIRGVSGGNGDYFVVAHEIGHNLGANHDPSRGNVMEAVASQGALPATFSTQSKDIFNQILTTGRANTSNGTVVASWGCLKTDADPSSPVSTPTATSTPGNTPVETSTPATTPSEPTPIKTQTPNPGTRPGLPSDPIGTPTIAPDPGDEEQTSPSNIYFGVNLTSNEITITCPSVASTTNCLGAVLEMGSLSTEITIGCTNVSSAYSSSEDNTLKDLTFTGPLKIGASLSGVTLTLFTINRDGSRSDSGGTFVLPSNAPRDPDAVSTLEALSSQLKQLTTTESAANPDNAQGVLTAPQVNLYQTGNLFEFEIENVPSRAQQLLAQITHTVRSGRGSEEVSQNVNLGSVDGNNLGLRGTVVVPRILHGAKISFFFLDDQGVASDNTPVTLRTNEARSKALGRDTSRIRPSALAARSIKTLAASLGRRFRRYTPIGIALSAPQIQFRAGRGSELLVLNNISRSASQLGVEISQYANGEKIDSFKGILKGVRPGTARLILQGRANLLNRLAETVTVEFYYTNASGIESKLSDKITLKGSQSNLSRGIKPNVVFDLLRRLSPRENTSSRGR